MTFMSLESIYVLFPAFAIYLLSIYDSIAYGCVCGDDDAYGGGGDDALFLCLHF